jgi:hypothetical protein
MLPIQLLFVDGPTGVGKDHLIDNFVYLYTKRYPNAKITKVRAADVVLQNEAKSEERKYTQYNTPLSLVRSIFDGHLRLLDHLSVQCDLLSENDLVIVNRSFLSYHLYNWKVLHDLLVTEGSKTTLDVLKDYNLESYAIQYKKRLQGVCSMFANVTLKEGNTGDKVKVLAERAMLRQDGKPIQTDWFSYLVKGYSSVPPAFTDLFNLYTILESKDSKLLLDTHFN